MGNSTFKPGDPLFARKLNVLSFGLCSLTLTMVLFNHDNDNRYDGFTPIRRYVERKGDEYFKLKPEELIRPPKVPLVQDGDPGRKNQSASLAQELSLPPSVAAPSDSPQVQEEVKKSSWSWWWWW